MKYYSAVAFGMFLCLSVGLLLGWIAVCWIWGHDQQTSSTDPKGYQRRQTPTDDRLLSYASLL